MIKTRVSDPGPFDLRVRALAQTRLPAGTARAMLPLYPLGLPGGYLTIGYATTHWLHRRGHRGGPAIVTAAWLGWLVQRAAKLIIMRDRPRGPRVVRRRIDSFPSGHTTGTTSTALAIAYLLRRERLISRGAAAAIGLAVPAVMGAYRVIDDEHWATDVIAGWAIGALVAAGCVALLGDYAGHMDDGQGTGSE